MLGTAAAEALEPRSERRVEAGTPGLGMLVYADLPRHGVLDRVLALALDGGAPPPPNEVALLEHT